MISPIRVAVAPVLFLVFAGAACREATRPLSENLAAKTEFAPAKWPLETTVFSSSREITDVQIAPDAVWAATTGGVLRLQNEGKQTKWSAREGLPANDVFGVKIGENIAANTFRGGAVLRENRWEKAPFSRLKLKFRGQKIAFSPDEISLGETKFPLPKESRGTHITGAVPEENAVRVAVWGEGFWLLDGAHWRFDDANLPPLEAREITALAPNFGNPDIVFGTRRNGVWRGRGQSWRQISRHDDEPLVANAQSFALFRGAFFASTLDDGVVFRSGNGWRHVTAPDLSSTAARHLAVWGEKLWVRHGTGVVDSFDGQSWRKNDLRPPRAGVYALDADEKRLGAAGWGGFALFDGQKWAPFYDLPALRGVPIVGIELDGQNVWLLTQSRGLMRFDLSSLTLEIFDERSGLSDDWITAWARGADEIYAGTFVGGLCRFDAKTQHFVAFSETAGENITAIAPFRGGVLATSRSGLWRAKGGRIWRVKSAEIEPELQTLLVAPEGENQGAVWLGGRTSFAFLPRLETG